MLEFGWVTPVLFVFVVWHAADNTGGAETHPFSCLPGPPDNEGHWEHHHQWGRELERELGELSNRVWGRWV